MSSPLIKAICVGIGTFLTMMVLFWCISKLAGKPFLQIPRRVTSPTTPPTATPADLPFLRTPTPAE